MKQLKDLTKEEYNRLNKSGMLFEIYPEAEGLYIDDCKGQLEPQVMPVKAVAGGRIDIDQVTGRIKQLLELNKEMLEEAPPNYKKMAESNALTSLLYWLESQREA